MSYIGHAEISTFLNDRVNLPSEDALTYREQVGRLREKLEAYIKEHPEFGLVKTLLAGSLAKRTALKTINDADVALYVKSDAGPQEEKEFLNWLAERLRSAYPNMSPDQVTPGNHVVCLSFKGTGLDVDILPVHYNGLSDDRGYIVSRETGDRLLTSIPLHLKFFRTRKDAHPGDFAQVVRLAKWWVKQEKEKNDGFRFKSFMVELVCAHLADKGIRFEDYPIALQDFLAYLVTTRLEQRIAFTDFAPADKLPKRGADPIEILDPVNFDNNVAKHYSEQDKTNIADRAESALDALAEAHTATTRGRAVSCWQRVVGPSFRG